MEYLLFIPLGLFMYTFLGLIVVLELSSRLFRVQHRWLRVAGAVLWPIAVATYSLHFFLVAVWELLRELWRGHDS